MMIIILVLVIAVIYYSTTGKIPQYFSGNKNPEALLKERFVTGEIDETTYLNMKQVIGK